MKLNHFLNVSCLALLFACASGALAASEQSIPGSSSATNVSKSTWEMLREKTAVGYYGIYYGPSATDPTNSRRTDEWGKTPAANSNQYFLNYLSVSYRASKTLLPGITVMSTYTPVRGQDMTLLDPYLRLTDTQLIKSGNWTLYGELREFVPVTKVSHNLHKMSTLGTFQWLTYNVPNTRLSVGTWAKFYWTIYGSGAATGSTDYQAYLRPQMFYTISPKVSASLYYEMSATHGLNKSATDWTSKDNSVQAGAMWNVMNGLILNPYLQFAVGGRMNADTTSLGAQFFATIL